MKNSQIVVLSILLICVAKASCGTLSEDRKIFSVEINKITSMAQAGDYLAAEKIARISKIDSEKFNDQDLQEVASLMNSPNAAIRLWSAAAIGNFGARALIYVPRLQRMVAEEACNMTGLSAADAANESLKKLGIAPNAFGCAASK